MTIIGAISLPQNPPESLRAIARAADEAGLEELWLWEDCFLNGGVSSAAAALAWTENLKVGIGIMPLPFRNVALTAMEIATLARFSGGRALPGIGHGVQDWMGQVGARAASPLTLLREYATALRSLLRGEEVTTKGRYVNLDAVKLDWPPAEVPPLFVGSTGPKTLALGGQVGDGTILTGGTSPAGVATALGHIAATAPHELVVFVPAAFGPGGAERLAEQQQRWGMDVPGVSGTPEEMAAGLREFAEAGATRLILQPTPDDPDPVAFVRQVAEEIRPLIA
ncbi:LLM class flavin-dependent oxidoreductase [Paractinoplanes globisporus]|uniref:LLM class flavin-dependent oxidoreductase n=1 Tax=Paractinoplanes globisporus TaxID=113565 RepID=A0ABW6WCF3_9ACTN|nr:LLM class flavin-dependent oxidoreductase [Actinoplanes globisporus]